MTTTGRHSYLVPHLFICLSVCNGQQSSHKSLLDVGEAETLCNSSNGPFHLLRKLDVIVVLKLFAPEGTIRHSLLQIRVCEQIFPIKTAWSLRDPRIQPFQMIGAANHQDPVIVLEPVDFVEKVGAHSVADDGVQVFEYEKARSLLPGFGEDLIYGVLWSIK